MTRTTLLLALVAAAIGALLIGADYLAITALGVALILLLALTRS